MTMTGVLSAPSIDFAPSKLIVPASTENVTWTAGTTALFLPHAVPPDASGTWGQTLSVPNICKNITDRSVYNDPTYGYMMIASGDANDVNPSTDYDQTGLFTSTSLTSGWADYLGVPLIPLNATIPSPDCGDVQASQFWHLGSREFLVLHIGNANPPLYLGGGPSDDTSLCMTLVHSDLSITRLGSVITSATFGDDVHGVYVGKLVPVGHDGLPHIFVTCTDIRGVFGIYNAVSLSGSIYGPYTAVSQSALFKAGGVTYMCDAWIENSQYEIYYFTGGTAGISLATTNNGIDINFRKRILAPSGTLFATPRDGSIIKVGSTWYAFCGGGGVKGVGVYTGV